MRERGEIGRVCIWDRPGYGFSDASESTEVGATVNALWEALGQSKEKGPFVLVGAGYGGILTRVFASRHPDMVYGHLFIDAYTARTYFLTGHRRSPLMHKHLPSLFSPLSLHRFPQALFGGRHSTSRLDRILGSTQNPLTLATLAQESTLSHSRSASFNTLVKSLETYPSDASTIILSSGNRTRDDKIWEKSQRDLWEDVTDEKGRLRWTVVDDVGHAICDDSRGREECEAAVSELVWH
ncbi:hypothetical protein FRC03_008293 [Tulasnella sp. 419]|nr:hypothetical protein FRC03_008293 [Tulasnella sp. 419]